MKRNHAFTPESPEQLLTSLRSLLAEAEQLLSDSAGEFVGEKAEEMKSRLEQAQINLQEFYNSTRKKVVTGARRADETIRTHPYESLAVALGVGVLLGALLRRNH
jgi:ElaB/YqjD/DUF883 family membrane-anchored ribosome-binding protein